MRKQERSEAALLLGWAAAEAVLRNLLKADEYDAASETPLSPVQIVKTAFSRGLIGREHVDVLLAAVGVRNAVSHGFRYTGPGSVALVTTSLLWALEELFSVDNPDQANHGSQHSADDMVHWFHQHYEPPTDRVPRDSAEGGYTYYLGGPYDPWEMLLEQFPDQEPQAVAEAVRRILPEGEEWVRRGQYELLSGVR